MAHESHYKLELYRTSDNGAIGSAGELMLFERHYNTISLKKPVVLDRVVVGLSVVCTCEGLEVFELASKEPETPIKITLIENAYANRAGYAGSLILEGTAYFVTATAI